MRLSYHSDTDSLYIHLIERPGVTAKEVAPGIVFDFDKDGKPVGIDIEHAKNVLDLSRIEANALPLVRSAG
ncbi:MAG: DUF2283 domain-containing protein [Chlamydiota bacterium]